MYEYAAGDIRGNTRELARAKSPETARRLCVALGVPEEHVTCWAVRSETEEQRQEIIVARRAIVDELADTRSERDRAEAEAESLRERIENTKRDLSEAERRKDAYSRAIDDALAELYRINCDSVLDAGDAERIRKVRDALGAL